jgi:integrase
MATIWQRGDGQWEASIRRNGWKPQRRTWSTKTKAGEWARQVEAQMDAGTFQEVQDTRKMPLHDLILRYKEEIAPKLEDCVEKCRIADVIDAEFGKVGVLNLLPKVIAKWRDKLAMGEDIGRPRAGSTVNHYLNTLSGIYTAGMKEFHMPIPFNPCKLVTRLREPPPRTQQWRENEVDLLVTANLASNKVRVDKGGRKPFGEFEWFLRLALEGAMRRGEIARLAIPFIELEDQTAHLPKTKNGEPRTIALSLKACEILRGAIAARKKDPLPDGRLFRLTVGGFKTAFRRARDHVAKAHPELRVKEKRFHDTRRTATTRLAKKLDIVELSQQTGIKTLKILKTYYQPDPAEMAKKLD